MFLFFWFLINLFRFEILNFIWFIYLMWRCFMLLVERLVMSISIFLIDVMWSVFLEICLNVFCFCLIYGWFVWWKLDGRMLLKVIILFLKVMKELWVCCEMVVLDKVWVMCLIFLILIFLVRWCEWWLI